MDCLRSLISTLDVISDVGFREPGFEIAGTLWGVLFVPLPLFYLYYSTCLLALSRGEC